jgi:RNA polymerase sigma factor (sigma-70 family)
MKKSSYTDEEIIKGIQSQNNDVLLYVYRKNLRSVRYYIEKNNGTAKDAEDLFQDALVLMYYKIREGSLELTSSFSTFLFSIVKLHWLKHLKQRERRKTDYEECDNFINENEGLLEDIIQAERKAVFVRHFNELTTDCQKIIRLSLKGLMISEITKLMGFNSEQHTKNRRFRCKKVLIEKILQDPYFKELTNERFGKDYQIPRW